LEYALYYLDEIIVEKIINNMDNIEKYEIMNSNILEYLMSSLNYFSGGDIEKISIDKITHSSFTSPYSKNKNYEITRCYKFCKILEIICKKEPKLIKETMINSCNRSMNHKLTKILSNYYENDVVNNDENEERCIYCFSSHKSELIENICLCKNKLHICCLIEYIKQNCNYCKVCKYDLKPHKDNRGRVYFPFSNIYPEPLMSYYNIIEKNDVENSLYFSSTFLIVERVEEILKNLSKEEYLNFRNKYIKVPKKAKFYIKFKLSENDFLMMTPYPTSNMSSKEYPEKHKSINNLFMEKDLLSLE